MDEENDALSADRVGAGDQMWLDLATADSARWARVQDELSSLRATVLDRKAYLVVILPVASHDLRNQFEDLHVRIDRPEGGEVLKRHLAAAGIDLDGDDHPLSVFAEELGRRPSMQWVANLVALIRRAHDQGTPTDGLARWCQDAKAAMSDHSAAVKDLVSAQSGLGRAVLLAVAMLHGSQLYEIQLATDILLRTTKHPPDEQPLLAQKSLSEVLKDIKAGEDQRGRVHFTYLGYDGAARAHFWYSRPDLRQYLIQWLDTLARSPGISEESREDLARRISDLCLGVTRTTGVS